MTTLSTSLNTLLFDLDGTLLPLDLDVFMKGYFEALLPRIAHLMEPQAATREIWAATEAMIKSEDPGLTNEQAFKAAFFGRTSVTEGDIWPVFDEFYRREFAKLRSFSMPSDISREICRSAIGKGYRVVVATNPIFPETAIRHRMDWAGVGDLPFDLVTTMENSHFCKPSPKYYVEIMDKLGVPPVECMMFGNDVQEDGVAGKLGMQTYLVTDCLIDRGIGHFEFNHRGTLADALAFVDGLPAVVRA